MPLATRCCGIPGCQYGSRQRGNRGANSSPGQGRQHTRRPMAHDPRSRWLDTGSRVLAVAAFCLGIVTAGSVALR